MDAIKKVLSPGAPQDDELMYGNAEERRRASVAKEPVTQPELYEVENAPKDHSILRQIVNPGGNKYAQ